MVIVLVIVLMIVVVIVVIFIVRWEGMTIVRGPRRRIWSVHIDLFVVGGGQNADVSLILRHTNSSKWRGIWKGQACESSIWNAGVDSRNGSHRPITLFKIG